MKISIYTWGAQLQHSLIDFPDLIHLLNLVSCLWAEKSWNCTGLKPFGERVGLYWAMQFKKKKGIDQLSIGWSRMDLERSVENDLFIPGQLMHFDCQDFGLLYYFILGLSKWKCRCKGTKETFKIHACQSGKTINCYFGWILAKIQFLSTNNIIWHI